MVWTRSKNVEMQNARKNFLTKKKRQNNGEKLVETCLASGRARNYNASLETIGKIEDSDD